MFDQDILAYAVLAVFYAVCIIPFIGALLTQEHGSAYLDDWKIGAIIHGVLIVFVVVMGSILWAFSKVVW
jgi:hypothetical protein